MGSAVMSFFFSECIGRGLGCVCLHIYTSHKPYPDPYPHIMSCIIQVCTHRLQPALAQVYNDNNNLSLHYHIMYMHTRPKLPIYTFLKIRTGCSPLSLKSTVVHEYQFPFPLGSIMTEKVLPCLVFVCICVCVEICVFECMYVYICVRLSWSSWRVGGSVC
jgi:hypothetical protein